MTDNEDRGVGRRAVLGAAGVAAVGAVAFVAPDARVWAAPAIRQAIGVPAAAASTAGQVITTWEQSAVAIRHTFDEFGGLEWWRGFSYLYIENRTDEDFEVVLTLSRTVPELRMLPYDGHAVWDEAAPTDTTQLWYTTTPVPAGGRTSAYVQFYTNARPRSAFSAQVFASAIPLGRSTEPAPPAAITITYDGIDPPPVVTGTLTWYWAGSDSGAFFSSRTNVPTEVVVTIDVPDGIEIPPMYDPFREWDEHVEGRTITATSTNPYDATFWYAFRNTTEAPISIVASVSPGAIFDDPNPVIVVPPHTP